MDIPFASRSAFLAPCELAIRSGNAALVAGQTIRIDLDRVDPGYAGRIVVNIREGESQHFGAVWESTDPTRFPARIRAAATALYNCRCFGTYLITHEEGVIEIRQDQPSDVQNS
jgi:hypothetical protein